MTGAIIIISLIFSAFFSGMEMAYVSSNRMLIELERKKKSWISKTYIFLVNHSKQYLTTIIIGNTVALVVYGYFMGIFLTNLLHIGHLSDAVILFLQTLISTFIILVTAEFLPKIIFNTFSNKLFRFFSPLAFLFYWLFYPVTLLIGGISSLFLRLLGDNKSETEPPLFLKEELSYFIDERVEGHEKEDIDSEVHFFKNALSFSNLQARNCMIHRKEIIAANIEDSLETLTQKFIENGFSKIVVYRSNIDNIIGYVHIFDLFKKPKSIKHILLPIEMVHETTPVQDVMNRMLKKSRTIAIVLDEYGGTSGLLTLEDIVEELFGNIEDEHDKTTEVEKEIGKNHYLFSAKLQIDYLNNKYNLSLPESEEYSSLAGFIISITEEIPSKGKEILYRNKKINITKVSNSQIEEVELILLEGGNE